MGEGTRHSNAADFCLFGYPTGPIYFRYRLTTGVKTLFVGSVQPVPGQVPYFRFVVKLLRRFTGGDNATETGKAHLHHQGLSWVFLK